MGMPYCLGGEILRCAILSPFHLLPPIVAELLGSLVVSTMDVAVRLAAKAQMLLVKIQEGQLLVSFIGEEIDESSILATVLDIVSLSPLLDRTFLKVLSYYKVLHSTRLDPHEDPASPSQQ